MRWMHVLSWMWLMGTFLVFVSRPLLAEEPPRPQWQRYLKGDDARKAAELEKTLTEAREAGRLAEALKLAKAIEQLRRRAQGADHWQIDQARYEADEIRRALRQGEKGQQEYVHSLVLQRRATAMQSAGLFKQVQPVQEEILDIRRRVLGEDHPHTANAYYNLGTIHTMQGRYPQGEEAYRKALAICRKVLGEEHYLTALCYSALASNQAYLGKYTQAETYIRTALAIHRKVLGEEHPRTATCYDSLASCRQRQGNPEEVEGYLQRALAIRRKVLGEKHADTAESYNNLALNQYQQGKYREAEESCRRALAIRREVLGDRHPQTAASYYGLATVKQGQGSYLEAEQGYRRALAIEVELFGEGHPSTAIGYRHLAGNLQAQGSYLEAEKCYQKALAIRTRIFGVEHGETATSYHDLGLNLQAQGKLPEAEETWTRALTLFRKVLGEKHLQTAVSTNNLAANLAMQGKHRQAEESYRKALTIWRALCGEEHPRTAIGYHHLATSHHRQGRYRQAEEGFRQALAIDRKVLGELHPQTMTCTTYLACSLSAQRKSEEAEALFRSAARTFDDTRLSIVATEVEHLALRDRLPLLPCLAAALARKDKPEEAWQRYEESLVRGNENDLSAQLRLTPDERDRLAQMAARIDRLNNRLEDVSYAASRPRSSKPRDEQPGKLRQAWGELAAFRRELEKKYGIRAGQVYSRQRIQAKLPADAALVGWLDLPAEAGLADRGGDHWAVLLRSSGPPVWVRLTGSGTHGAWTDADTELPGRLRAALQDPGSDWKPLARRLRRQRLDLLAHHLEGVRHLLVLPSTALAGVPIEVLTDRPTVSYVRSGTLHTYLHQQPRLTGTALLALADPVFDPRDRRQEAVAGAPAAATSTGPGWPECLWASSRSEWKRLPVSRFEVAALQRLFAGPGSRVLLDSDASEQQLRALAQSGRLARYSYLHLATHAQVNRHFPLRSAVILAGDQLPSEEQRLRMFESAQPIPDGRLSAEEVLQHWDLNSELVTLSACQAPQLKDDPGDGFNTLAQAFLLAGSHCVCLSLWKADDTATALLMDRFYQNLLGKRQGLKAPLGKAQALAEARAWLRDLSREEARQHVATLLRETGARGLPAPPLPAEGPGKDNHPYAHPRHWAAFVLIGDAS